MSLKIDLDDELGKIVSILEIFRCGSGDKILFFKNYAFKAQWHKLRKITWKILEDGRKIVIKFSE